MTLRGLAWALLLAAAPAARAGTAPPLSPLPDDFGHTGLWLVVVLVFLGLGVYLVRNGLPGAPRNAGERHLHIRESRALGNRQFLIVVEYDETRMLLGVTPGKIDYLCPLPPAPLAPSVSPAPAAPPAPPAEPPKDSPRFTLPLLLFLCLFLGAPGAQAQDRAPVFPPRLALPTTPPATAPAEAPEPAAAATPAPVELTAPTPGGGSAPLLSLQVGNGNDKQNVSSAIQIVAVMTLLTLAPSLVMMMTSFTRIVIVLGFVRTALGVQGAPSNQIVIGLSLFLTFFIMAPVVNKVNDEALQPFMNNQLAAKAALDKAAGPFREFMERQTRPSETEFFLRLAGTGPTRPEDVPMRVAIPAFVLSELRTAFQMGFLIFVPFLAIDFLVSSTLMSMGMMMMPPVVVSLPFKLLLFVLVDGWQLVIRSLVESFAV
jgi:flagellar biosynthetic protein FliP